MGPVSDPCTALEGVGGAHEQPFPNRISTAQKGTRGRIGVARRRCPTPPCDYSRLHCNHSLLLQSCITRAARGAQKHAVLSDPSLPEHYRLQLARSLQRDLFVWVPREGGREREREREKEREDGLAPRCSVLTVYRAR